MKTVNVQGRRFSENVAKEALKDQGLKPTKTNLTRLAELAPDRDNNNYLSRAELSKGAAKLVKELGGGTPGTDLKPNRPIGSVVKNPPASMSRYAISISDDRSVLTFDPRRETNLLAARAAKSVNIGHTAQGGVTVSLEGANGEASPFKDGRWVKKSFTEVVKNPADLKRLTEAGYDVKAKRDVLVANTESDATPTIFALRDKKIDQDAPPPVGGPRVRLAAQDLTRGFVAVCTETTIAWFGDRPQITVKKPVIYVYPAEKTTVNLHVIPTGTLSVTYPESADGRWKLVATPDGTLFDPVTERRYSYVFWEAQDPGTLAIEPARAHLVARADVAGFLERASNRLGLNDKERTDFVSFWLPAMQRNAMSMVQFLVGAEVDRVARLEVEPRPDAELRVFMMFQAVVEPVAVGAPEVPALIRGRYTLVEWGGANLDEV